MIKTLSKPVSKRIKKDFSRTKATQGLLVSLGQATHSLTSRMTIWSAGYKVRSITPLEEDVALSRGADIVGETFVLMVTAGTMIWEYNRSKAKETAKDEKRRAEAKAEREALQENFKALDERLSAVEEVVKYNSESILNVAGKRYVPPKQRKLVDVAAQEDQVPNDAKTRRYEETLDNNMQSPKEGSDDDKPWWKFW